MKTKKVKRHESILAALELNPALRVNELADTLGVSPETIRRDLTDLQQSGQISRTYGGAVSTAARFEPVLAERMMLHLNERRAIARTAVSLCASEDALLLGGGATMLHFAKCLKDVAQRLTIITPSYPVAIELAGSPNIDVMVLPGLLDAQEHIVCGPETLRAIERYAVRTAVVGASGVSEDGVSEALLSAGEVYGAIIGGAEQTYVLADQSKFGKRALVLLGGWTSRTTLITNIEPPEQLGNALAREGAALIIAEQ